MLFSGDPQDRWYQNYSEIWNLAHWLDGVNYFASSDAVIDFFEKPWHYENQYKVYQFFQKEHTFCPDCAEIDACDCFDSYTDIEEYLAKLEVVAS